MREGATEAAEADVAARSSVDARAPPPRVAAAVANAHPTTVVESAVDTARPVRPSRSAKHAAHTPSQDMQGPLEHAHSSRSMVPRRVRPMLTSGDVKSAPAREDPPFDGCSGCVAPRPRQSQRRRRRRNSPLPAGCWCDWAAQLRPPLTAAHVAAPTRRGRGVEARAGRDVSGIGEDSLICRIQTRVPRAGQPRKRTSRRPPPCSRSRATSASSVGGEARSRRTSWCATSTRDKPGERQGACSPATPLDAVTDRGLLRPQGSAGYELGADLASQRSHFARSRETRPGAVRGRR